MWVQFPDLTEEFSSNWSTSLKKLSTQFAFCTTSPNTARSTITELRKLGFKCVSSMRNWHEGHSREHRKLNLYWYKSPIEQKEPCKMNAQGWCSVLNDKNRRLQITGCGFAISDKLNHRFYWRYHTLMRMPVHPSPHQLRWLERCHYFKIDEGALSSYWVNGFPPKKYSWEKEEEYWKSVGISPNSTDPLNPAKFARAHERTQKLYAKRMKEYDERVKKLRAEQQALNPQKVSYVNAVTVPYACYNIYNGGTK